MPNTLGTPAGLVVILADGVGLFDYAAGAGARVTGLVVALRCAEAAPTAAQLDGSVRVCVESSGGRKLLDTFVPLVHHAGALAIPIDRVIQDDQWVTVRVFDARDTAGAAFAVAALVTLLGTDAAARARVQ